MMSKQDEQSGTAKKRFQRAPRQDFVRLNQLATKLTDPLLRKRGFAEGRVIRDWEQIIGSDLASCTSLESLDFPRSGKAGGTLKLRVSPGRALEVQHQIPQLIARVNSYFGWAAVEKVSLSQGLLPRVTGRKKNKIQKLTDNQRRSIVSEVSIVENRELRERLEALGEVIAQRLGSADK